MCQQPNNLVNRLKLLNGEGQPSIRGHMVSSIAIAILAGMVWVATSWTQADLSRRWGFCQPIGLMGHVKKTQQSETPSTNSLYHIDRVRKVVWPWGSSLPLIEPNKFLEQAIFPTPSANQAQPNKETIRLFQELNRQTGIIAYLEWRNCEITSYFINRQLSTFSMATLMALFALGCLILISKKGWVETNNVWINICVSSGLITVIAFNYSTLFGFIGARPNSDLFLAGYIRAANLSNRLRSSANTLAFDMPNPQQQPNGSESLDLNNKNSIIKLINYLNKEIPEINIVNASFDASLMKETGAKFMQNSSAQVKDAPQPNP